MEKISGVDESLVAIAANIVAAHIGNNKTEAQQLPGIIKSVYDALNGLGQAAVIKEEAPKPAVSVRSSVKPDYIICLEDGKKLKILKRHLMTSYGLTPDEYREKWNLPADYPMVAPNYAAFRKALAHQNGLGQKTARRNGKSGKTATSTVKPARRKAGERVAVA